jgi:hypothetical protein
MFAKPYPSFFDLGPVLVCRCAQRRRGHRFERACEGAGVGALSWTTKQSACCLTVNCDLDPYGEVIVFDHIKLADVLHRLVPHKDVIASAV